MGKEHMILLNYCGDTGGLWLSNSSAGLKRTEFSVEGMMMKKESLEGEREKARGRRQTQTHVQLSYTLSPHFPYILALLPTHA